MPGRTGGPAAREETHREPQGDLWLVTFKDGSQEVMSEMQANHEAKRFADWRYTENPAVWMEKGQVNPVGHYGRKARETMAKGVSDGSLLLSAATRGEPLTIAGQEVIPTPDQVIKVTEMFGKHTLAVPVAVIPEEFEEALADAMAKESVPQDLAERIGGHMEAWFKARAQGMGGAASGE